MADLGGYYYELKKYDLALKYYNMAAELGSEGTEVCLGYVWYYGRTGKVDYEKAFHYFSMAGRNPVAEYKIADMYHNGYYVEMGGVKIGYVPEKDNAIFSRLMDAGKLLVAYITGMQKRSVDYQQISIVIYLVDF